MLIGIIVAFVKAALVFLSIIAVLLEGGGTA